MLDRIGTGAAHVLSNTLPNPEGPSALPFVSLAFGPRPYSTIPDTGKSLGITLFFFPELGRITSQNDPSTTSLDTLFIYGEHVTDKPRPEGLSRSTVKLQQTEAIGSTTATTSSSDPWSYFTLSTPTTSGASRSKAASILHHLDADAPGTVPLLRTGEMALAPSSFVNLYRLSHFPYLNKLPQLTPGSSQKIIRTMESTTAISFRSSFRQKIQPGIKTDVFPEPTPKFHFLESKSVPNTARIVSEKNRQFPSSCTWTTASGDHSTEKNRQPDVTNLEGPLPSVLSENSGRSTTVVPETSAGIYSPGRSVSPDALRDAAASHTVNKRGALASIGAVSGAVCLFIAIFEWARRRIVARGTMQIHQMKTRDRRSRDPNRSYFSLDS